jgi:hypothetical protein
MAVLYDAFLVERKKTSLLALSPSVDLMPR